MRFALAEAAESDGVARKMAFDSLQYRARGWIAEATGVNNIHSVNCYAELTQATPGSPDAEFFVPR